ncbi:MAG: V-type ATP synthase subunit D [Myxococcota bacterium]
MEKVPPTRVALLGLRRRARLAEQGRDLLEEKRRALMKALRDAAGDVLDATEELDRSATLARRALGRAEAEDGPEAVRSAAWAGTGEVEVETRVRTVMGVRVPEITRGEVARARVHRGFSLAGTSPHVDEVSLRFEDEVRQALEVAAGQRRLERLADEVGRTTRRVNALEHVLLPRLEAQQDRVEMVLDEREREERFRMRRVKSLRARRRGRR